MGRRIFALIVAVAFFYIISPMILPVIMGGVIAVLFSPLLVRLERKRLSAGLGSALLTVGITLTILIPASLLVYFGAKVGLQQLQTMKDAPKMSGDWTEALTNNPKVQPVLQWITNWYPVEIQELATAAQDLARSIGAKAAEVMGGFFAQLPGMVMGLAVIIVSIYFFLVDGKGLVLFFRRNSFFSPDQTEQLIHTLEGVCRSVILASVVSGLCQALFEGTVLVATGTPNAALLTFVVFLSSFVPLIGTAPVTFGLAIQQFLAGNSGIGTVLVVSALVVTTMDNFIRPWFLRGSANLHPLLAFIAAFGGLQTLGFVGIFLGPILAAAFVATLQMLLQGDAPSLVVTEKIQS